MTINIAMIGTGRIAGASLAPAVASVEGVRLWSVLSRDRGRAREFGERHGAAGPDFAFDDLNRLVEDPSLDAVIIATPDKLHAEQTLACARAGKHVFVEKPMATSVEDAQAMCDACGEAGVKLGVAYHLRWHAGHRALARRAHAGELGELRHVRVHWSRRAENADNWRASPEVGRWWSLAGVGTHCLDQIRWLLLPSCGEVVQIESVTDNSVWRIPHDETAILCLKFASGASAVSCTSMQFDAPRRMEVYGSRGWAVCEDTLGPGGAGRVWTNEGELPFDPVDPYAGEIRDFADAIVHNREPEVGGEEGMRNVELLVRATA